MSDLSRIIEFHQASALPAAPFRNDGLMDPARWPSSWTRDETKLTPQLCTVPLDRSPLDGSLQEVLARRASRRDGGGAPWDAGSVGTLLAHAVGVRSEDGEPVLSRRAYPSAGARFPVEIHLLADGLDPAANVFHYAVAEHRLHGIQRLDRAGLTLARLFGTDWAADAYGAILITAVLERSSRKYLDRAYRYALIEAGHLVQNLLLVATALDKGITPVGGFADRMATSLAGADGVQEVALYAVVLT